MDEIVTLTREPIEGRHDLAFGDDITLYRWCMSAGAKIGHSTPRERGVAAE
jgi:hypothetical protein